MSRIVPALVKLLSHMPFPVMYAMSDMLFCPVYHLVRYRRKVVRRNLTESFPEKSLREIRRIEKRFYHHMIDTFLETTKLGSLSPEDMARHMKFTNVDEVNEILKAGKSISVYIGHFGNWEWISASGMWLNTYSDCLQIYHKLADKHMDGTMMKLRERFGNKCVEMRHTVRYVAAASKNPRPLIIGFIADHSPKRRDANHYIRFLNHEVPVLTGTEKLTKHFGFGAMFMSVKKVKRGYYEAEFRTLHDNPGFLPDFELTSLYFKRLEKEIRETPELYLWSHNRFKYALDRQA